MDLPVLQNSFSIHVINLPNQYGKSCYMLKKSLFRLEILVRRIQDTSSYRLLRRIQLNGSFELAVLIKKNCLGRDVKSDAFSFTCLLFCLIMMFEKVKYEYLIFGFSNKKNTQLI